MLMRLAGFILIASTSLATVAGQDAAFKRLGVIKAGDNPHQIAFSLDGKTAYVAASGSDSVAVIDAATLQLTSQHAIKGSPRGVAALPDGKSVAVSLYRSDRIVRYLLPDFEPQGEIITGRGPSRIAGPMPNDAFLVSAEQANRLIYFDGRTFQTVKEFPTGKRPFPPSHTPDGFQAFVPNYDDGTVTMVSLGGQMVLATIEAGKRPSGGWVLPSGRLYAVALRGENKLSILDTRSGQKILEVVDGVGKAPTSVAMPPNNRLIFVCNTGSNDITVLKTTDGASVARIKVGKGPAAMAVHPSGESLWVSSERSDEVTVLEIPEQWRGDITQDVPELPTEASPQEAEEMDKLCRKEVLELHRFFEDWFNAVLTDSEEDFSRFANVLADDFEIIGPGGDRVQRLDLLQRLRQSFGRNQSKPMRIWVENFSSRPLAQGLQVVTYEEWQEQPDGDKRGRLSTALLRRKLDLPNGVEWVHVHETWLP